MTSDNSVKIEVGQVWRKLGPCRWLKIEKILDPEYPGYDGGIRGCVARYYPDQVHGINLRGGQKFFVAGIDWQEQIKRNRFLYEKGQPNCM